jgi:trigger factor
MSSDLEEQAGEGADEAAGQETEGQYTLSLDVNIEKVGPCKRHVKVRVPRADIDHYYNDSIGELVQGASVPGFRPGHVPRKLVEKRFKKEVADQLKQKLLLDSLEQLSDEHELDAINEPNLQIETLVIPDEGDFEYEFDVEVRPEFDLPDYSGLTIDRPNRDVTDADVEDYRERFLSQFGHLHEVDEPAALNDFVEVDAHFVRGEDVISHLHDQTLRVRPTLRFADAEIANFGDKMTGAKAGDERAIETTISVESPNIEMRGETVTAKFLVKAVKKIHLPEVNKEFLATLGVDSVEQFDEELRKVLERQITYEQRQTARNQVLEKITESADWDLPESLVRRQVENALRREILEMQQAGFTDQEIAARENELRQASVTSTRQALKEHFVLDRIATEEKLEVTPADIETEIYLMASQRGESPRRVRARLEKSGMIENLSAQILERKAIDVVLDRASYKDVEMPRPEANRVEAVQHAICGEETVAQE